MLQLDGVCFNMFFFHLLSSLGKLDRLRYPGCVPGSHTSTIYSENHLLRNGKGKMESFNYVGGFHQVTVMIVKPMNKHVSVLQKPRMMLAFCHYLYSLLPLMRLCL